jgi:glycosyltransferase involved in cell wall biosynthesis
MRAIRLAVLFDQRILEGGGYQQALNAAMLTKELSKDLVEVFYFTTLKENLLTLSAHGIKAEIIKINFFSKAIAYVRMQIVNPRLLKFFQKIQPYSHIEKNLINHKIDLVYFLSPSFWAQSLEKLNYITTVWDLCHRDEPEFPEVRWNRQFEDRELKYRAILPRATAVFVDSELGKMNIFHRYGVGMERIHIMPFQPTVATRTLLEQKVPGDLSISEKYQLDIPYVFYPAQFWAHKNHVYFLEGLRLLEENYGKRIGAIFSGGDKGNRTYIENYINSIGFNDRIRFTGFVTSEEIILLYCNSIALVMPSYFGPTNLPPLEAFQLGIPVLYPDKPGLREQVEGAALLMDLNNPESMAINLNKLIEDNKLRFKLINAGYKRLRDMNLINRTDILARVIKNFQRKRVSWE